MNFIEKTKHLKWGRDSILQLLEEINLDNANTILDIGCGEGSDLENIVKKFSLDDPYGIEFLDENRIVCESKGISCSAVDIERDPFPFQNEFFDLVISNQVFEHIKNIFWCMSEIARVLKKGKFVLIGVPNLASPHCSLPLLFGKQPRQIQAHGPHVRGYTVDGLIDLFEKDGFFKFVKYSSSGFYPFPVKISKCLNKIFPLYGVSIFCIFQRTDKEGELAKEIKKYCYETSYFLNG